MLSIRSLVFVLVLPIAATTGTSASAAPLTVNGAQFDAPAGCTLAEAALVCKIDGQQFELWITRKPLAPDVVATEPFVKKLAYFTDVHDSAVVALVKATNNESSTPFSNYGSFPAMGASLPGKGVPTAPSAHFASVLHDEEVWQFLEVVVKRTPAIEALSTALQSSLKLPAAKPAAVTPQAAAVESVQTAAAPAPAAPTQPEGPTPPDATFTGKRLSLQYPTFLQPQVIEDSTDSLIVEFKHTFRASGPHLTVSLRPTQNTNAAAKPASLVAARKAALTDAMSGKSDSVEINRLGAITGVGFALIGVPDPAKGGTGVESIETNFAAEVNARVLSVRLNAEQKHTGEAQAVWGLLGRSLSLRP